ncbi:ABC transporter substrate-binding protein [Rhizobium sp. GN54]|uniref:ABC transporter substrate-binding protein n=1 Tax=Rhizobium sp. GN54 TaxID=2898150 RepID=UPI001E404C4F|nr:ABC transporter substrate-binding protein [Rhizobium sp. GN54]MCD2184752.1 ABC transporter substrate-binding protein [Rhizobium sp. GN54]
MIHALKKAIGLVVSAAIFSAAVSAAGAEDNPLGLIEPGKLHVGTISDGRPYSFIDGEGNFVGFEIDYFNDLAKRMGFDEGQVVVTAQDFTALLPSVANGRFDVAFAAIGTTPERLKTVDFSTGYLAGFMSIMTPDESIKTPKDLAGKRIGVLQGSIQETYAAKNFKNSEIVRFPSNNAAVVALVNGSISGYFLDYEGGLLFLKQYPQLKMTINISSSDAPAGFAIKRGNVALKAALDKAIKESMAEGVWQRLYEKWLPGVPMPEQYLPNR